MSRRASFGDGDAERYDLAAAMDLVAQRSLPHPWLLGWSFGTEVVLKYGLQHPIDGAILLSPPLHRATDAEVAAWAGSGTRLVAVIPELDDYLRPAEAAKRFAAVPEIELVDVAEGRHLWVGEKQTRRVLTEIVARLNPAALPLPTEWPDREAQGRAAQNGPERYSSFCRGTTTWLMIRSTAAATGMAMSAPRMPSSEPPARAAMTTITPGTFTARFITLGLMT